MQNNAYSVDKGLEVKQNRKTFITPGIRENIKLVDVVYEVSPKGNDYLAFYFEDNHGDVLSHTEFPVKESKPFNQMSEQEQLSFLKSIDSQKRRIGQIVTTFVPAEQYAFVANNFKEFAENIIRILKNRNKDKLCRAKIVYDDRNFTKLPRYWVYPFIESMDIPKEDSKLKLLNIDKVERSTPEIVSNSSVEELGISPDVVEPKEDKDYLPF